MCFFFLVISDLKIVLAYVHVGVCRRVDVC